MPLSDEDLARLPACGEHILRRLIGRHGWNLHFAEDCVADAIADICRRRNAFEMRSETQLIGLVGQMAYFRGLDKFRKLKNEPLSTDDDETEQCKSEAPSLSEELLRMDEVRMVRDTMKKMAANCVLIRHNLDLGCREGKNCQLLLAFHVEEIGLKSVAEILGSSIASVHRHKDECQAKFKAMWGELQ